MLAARERGAFYVGDSQRSHKQPYICTGSCRTEERGAKALRKGPAGCAQYRTGRSVQLPLSEQGRKGRGAKSQRWRCERVSRGCWDQNPE